MSTTDLAIDDLLLVVKAQFFDTFGRHRAQRACLLKLLAVREERYGKNSGHAAIGWVKEQLAFSYLSWSTADLEQAQAYALEAEAILTATGRHGRDSFRVANLVHLRSQAQQRLHHPRAALELAEDAFNLYNRTRMVSWQRARVMESLITLHKVVGDPERAKKLDTELRVLYTVLNTRSARHRYM